MTKAETGFFAGLAVATALGATVAQAAVVAPPAGSRVVDFDDLAATTSFVSATVLTDRYAALGVTFEGVGINGGALLNGSSFLGITGESGPNFLAFNTAAKLQGGVAVPQMPETLKFRHAASRVQVNVASLSGTGIQAEAFDEDGASLGSSSVPASGEMQTLVLEFPRIAKVVLTTDAGVAAVDDLAFTLATTLVDFDDRVQPESFVETVAARDEYLGRGVRFFGGSTDDGAGLLAEGDGWGISGFSPPNILAINNLFGTFKFGGHPVFPQYISFEPPVKLVRFKAGGSGGGTLQVEAYDTGGTPIGSTSATMESTMKTLSIATAGIATVKLSGDAPFVAIDDLEYLVQGTVIDFDDDTNAPAGFAAALPLRDRYEALGVSFSVKGEGGPAILDQVGGFGVTGYSPPKHLSWNFESTLQNGAQPSLPVYLHFDPPIQRIEFLAGSVFGGEISLEAWDAVGTSVGTTDMTLTGKMQTLALPAEGAVDVTIYAAEESQYGILDNLAFQPVDACGHSACYVGDPLAYHCDPCVTKVCASNSDCCNDSWDLACAQTAESTCGLFCAPLCGDANSDRRVTSTDALSALRTAVGTGSCPVYRCDFSGDGLVKSGDALLILKLGVGQSPTPKCPAAPPIL